MAKAKAKAKRHPPASHTSPPQPASKRTSPPAPPADPWDAAKATLLARLQRWPTSTAFPQQMQRVCDMVTTAVRAGESNSIMVVGPRGCGKSTLVHAALALAAADPVVAQRGFHTVLVSGLCQTEDAAALKHVVASLLAPALAPGTVPPAAGWAATSGPTPQAHASMDGWDEEAGEALAGEEDQSSSAAAGAAAASAAISAAETARALREAMLAGSQESTRGIVVVVEEIDVFAHHGQQTFLYTLLDLVQSGRTPLVVIGITCRLDITSMLEKRVLSRFSQRQLHLFNSWTLEAFCTCCLDMVSLPPGFQDTAFAHDWNTRAAEALRNATVVRELQTLHETSGNNLRALQQVAWSAIAMVTRERPYLDPHDFFDARLRQAADAKVAMLLSASALELCLVIAARQLAQRGAPAANFEQIYDTYRRFAAGLQREALDFYQKPVAQKAFEHLCDMELLRPADGRAYPVTDVFRPMQLMLTSQQLTETIDKCSTLASRVKIWAKANGL